MSETVFLNRTIVNNNLVTLLKEVREKPSEQKMLELLSEATEVEFVVPVDCDDAKEGKFSFHALKGKEDRLLLVVFADTNTFNKANSDLDIPPHAVSAGFVDLIRAVLNNGGELDGFIINPGFEEVVFGRGMLKMIAEQMAVQDNARAKIGDPDHYPENLLEKVNEFGKAECVVNEIYVRICQIVGSDKLQWLFLIDHDGRDEREDVFNRFKHFIAPYLDGLGCLMIDNYDDLAEGCKQKARPQYKANA